MRKLLFIIPVLCFINIAQADAPYLSSAICNNNDLRAQAQKVIFLRDNHYNAGGVLDSNRMLVVFVDKNDDKMESSFALSAELESSKGKDGFKVHFVKSPFDDVCFPISSGKATVEIIDQTFECSVHKDFFK